jgi:hypothetical protein
MAISMLAVPMARHLKGEDVHQLLTADLPAKAANIRQRYGPEIGWDQLQELLRDPEVTPFPCEVRFDATPLLPGEFGHPVAKGELKEHGFIIYLHPQFATQLSQVPYLVLHQLVLINYGEVATPEDAETFGAIALGLSKDAYYRVLCELSSQIGGDVIV